MVSQVVSADLLIVEWWLTSKTIGNKEKICELWGDLANRRRRGFLDKIRKMKYCSSGSDSY